MSGLETCESPVRNTSNLHVAFIFRSGVRPYVIVARLGLHYVHVWEISLNLAALFDLTVINLESEIQISELDITCTLVLFSLPW